MNEYNLEELDIVCPYCGAVIPVIVDFSGGAQEYYEDCSVCCAPIFFSLTAMAFDGSLKVEVRRDDE